MSSVLFAATSYYSAKGRTAVVAGINLPILLNLKGIKDKACIIDYS